MEVAPTSPAARLSALWARYRRELLLGATLLTVVVALVWIGYQGWRLVLQPVPEGAIDLRLRWRETQAWFAPRPVYGAYPDAVYPPASYLILRPFVGFGALSFVRWVWAGVTVVSLYVLSRTFVRGSAAEGRAERRFLALLPLALYPVGATIGNGQLGIAIVTCLAVALPMLERRPPSLVRDLLIALLVLLALVKPSISAFFFLIVMFAPGGWRPAALTVLGYALATWLASLPRAAGPIDLMLKWKNRSTEGIIWGARFGEGAIVNPTVQPFHLPKPPPEQIAEAVERGVVIKSISVHSLLSYAGVPRYAMAASIVLLAIYGLWVLWRRRASVWTLMAVTAIVALFSGYHAWYDHVILTLPLLALYRHAKLEASITSAVLFALLFVFLLAPGGVYFLPVTLSNVYVVLQTLVLLCVMAHLMRSAGREHVAALG